MSESNPERSRALLWIRRILLTIVGIVLGWLVVANIFLNTPIAPWTINRRPERWQVRWDRAWSPYPGRVIARGVVYTHHIGRIDVFVRAENASATIPIRPLFERRFVLEGIDADRARASLGMRPPQPPKPPAPKPASAKPRKPGWTIEIVNARVASIEEFAFDDFALSGGTSSVSGTFTKQLGGDMALRDIALSWKDAQIKAKGSKDPARSVGIGFRGGMSPFNPRVDRGFASLRHLSGTLDVEGYVLTLAPLQALFGASDFVSGLRGAGEVSTHLLIANGRLSPDSRLSVRAEKLAVLFLGFEASGSGTVGLSRNSVKNGDSTHVTLVIDSYRFGRANDPLPLALGRNLNLKIDAVNARLGRPAEEVKAVLDMPVSEMPDISVLGAWLPESLGLKLEKGRATLSARVESSGIGRPASGTLHVRGEDLSGRFRDLEFRIDLDANMRISGKRLGQLEGAIEGTQVRFFNGDIRGERVPVEPGWWMTVGFTNGKADLRAPLAVEGDIDLSMRDIRALIAVFAEMKPWLSKVDGILSVKDLRGHTYASMGQDHVSFHDLSVTGDRLACEAEIDLGSAAGSGLLWMKFRRRDLAFEWEGQKRDWKFYDDRDWFDKRRAERTKGR